MDLEIPLPKALVALTPLLPLIVLAGWGVARRLFGEWLTALVASFGLAIAGWTLFTHVFGRLTHSFSTALVLSSVSLALGGVILWLRDRRRNQLFGGPSRRELAELLTFALAMTAPIVVVAWRWSFYDEIGAGGHQPMIANIQNGYYPPRSLSFPEFELAYHYGFDLFCAMLTAIFRVSVVHAIDIANSALWLYCVLAAWLLGERVVGKRSGALVATVMLLGGGFPFTCAASTVQSLPIAPHFLAFCVEGGMLLNPPLGVYFFQHPWGLGLPLALSVLLVESEESARAPKLRIGALLLLFGGLYLAHVSLFLALLSAVSASALLSRSRQSLRLRLATVGLLALGGWVAVETLGGFFAGGSSHVDHLTVHLGVTDDPKSTLHWMAASFGVPLLGLLGLLWLPRKRILYASLALGGMLVINSVRYEFSWDIVKFATVAALGLSLPFSALVHRLQACRNRVLQSWLPVCLLLPTVFSVVVFLTTLALALPGLPWMYSMPQPALTEDARATATFLRRTMPPDTVMYRRGEDYVPYAIYAGLPQVWINAGFATDRELGPARNELITTLPKSPAPYWRQRIRFFVLDAADTRLNPIVDDWLARGLAKRVATFGALRVIELLPQSARA